MSQLAVGIKAELTGTKALGKAAILFGCQKMFDDAASHFNVSGIKEYFNRCRILSYLSKARAYLHLNEHYREKCETTRHGAGLCTGLCNEVKV